MTPAASDRTAFIQLAALGAAIAALTLLAPLAFKTWGDNGYIALTIPAGCLALAATGIAERGSSTRILWLIVALAVGLRCFLLTLEPLLSSDIYRYVWDGRVQAAGINPYRYVPDAPALASLRDAAIYPHINRPDSAVTIYPPVAQMFFFLVTRLGETVTTMRVAFLACEAVAVAMIWMLLRQASRPVTRTVAYLWHPLPMWEIANSGHIDALMIALMMTGLWLVIRRMTLRGVAAISLAALAKPFAILALPVCWRPWDWRAPTLAVAIAAACYAPYVSVGTGVFGFLAGYLREEGIQDGGVNWPLNVWRLVFGVQQADATIYLGLAGLILAILALRTAFRPTRTEHAILADTCRLLLVFLLLLSPRYPWYFLALMPFVALQGGATLWAASIGALLLQEEVDFGEYVPLFARKTALYGAIAVAWLWSVWRHRSNIRTNGAESSDMAR
jgi:alpha-1,6-mannosyltransferase